MLATAGLLPLVCFGVWSLATVNRATRESVTAGNLRLAALEAEQIARVVGDAEVSQIVDRIRVGTSGGALLIQSNGVVIAASHTIRPSDTARDSALIGALAAAANAASWSGEYVDDKGVRRLGVTSPVKGQTWLLMLEQPTQEAFAASSGLGRQLALAALVALVLMMAVGFIIGRRFIAPILSLEQATHAVAEGHFDARVPTVGTDEFTRLARSFNTMADRLVSLQESIKSQERQVMFGRVVAGMFHDLSHPIETIVNNAHLLLGSHLDENERRVIGRTIDRERATLRRFLDDVLNVARPRPLDRFPIDVNAVVADVIDAMRAEAARSQVALTGHYATGAVTMAGDRFALGRVYRNLIVNAIQATGSGGRVLVNTSHGDGIVEIEVSDTGVGIPPDRLSAIFDDFVTTKKRGLGLGLATSRRIVEQLGGSIRVSSEVGRGSTFTVHFPSSAARLAEATG